MGFISNLQWDCVAPTSDRQLQSDWGLLVGRAHPPKIESR